MHEPNLSYFMLILKKICSANPTGYCSEAISFAMGLMHRMPVLLVQHGDGYNQEFIRGLPNSLVSTLQQLFETSVDVMESVVVCHSEAGAWVCTALCFVK